MLETPAVEPGGKALRRFRRLRRGRWRHGRGGRLNLGGLGGFDFKAIGDGAAVQGNGRRWRRRRARRRRRQRRRRRRICRSRPGTSQSHSRQLRRHQTIANAPWPAALNWIHRHQGQDGGWSLDIHAPVQGHHLHRHRQDQQQLGRRRLCPAAVSGRRPNARESKARIKRPSSGGVFCW